MFTLLIAGGLRPHAVYRLRRRIQTHLPASLPEGIPTPSAEGDDETLASAPTTRQTPLPPLHLEGPGEYDFEIVGEYYHRNVLAGICGGDKHERPVLATLVHEADNPHDDQAIRVDVEGQAVGYLTRVAARQYRKWLASKGNAGRTVTCAAIIVPGWNRVGYDLDDFGIKLDLPSLYS